MDTKKFLAVSLIILLTATIFSGCTRNERAVSGAGGGITLLVALQVADHFTSIASNTDVLLKNNSDSVTPNTQNSAPKKSEVVQEDETPEKIATQDKSADEEEKNSKKPGRKTAETPAPPIEEKTFDDEPNVKYKRFTDKTHGFSFDYPVEGDKSLIVDKDFEQSDCPAGQAMEYSLTWKHSRIIIGMDFADSPLVYDIRGVSREDMKIKVEKLGDGIFSLTWIDPSAREDYIQKSFFGKTHYSRKEHHYIKYIYNLNTPEKEKAVAQHMIDTFDSGFE